jgi:hypothetical protein
MPGDLPPGTGLTSQAATAEGGIRGSGGLSSRTWIGLNEHGH